MAGINPAPDDPKEAGIKRFKEKWGGRKVAFGIFTREEQQTYRRKLAVELKRSGDRSRRLRS